LHLHCAIADVQAAAAHAAALLLLLLLSLSPEFYKNDKGEAIKKVTKVKVVNVEKKVYQVGGIRQWMFPWASPGFVWGWGWGWGGCVCWGGGRHIG
jgi:hypothetical protein